MVRYFVLYVLDLRSRRVELSEILKSSAGETVKLPARSPNLKAYAERFVRSIESERLAQKIPLGERHPGHAVKEYTEQYHVERNHQGLDDRPIG